MSKPEQRMLSAATCELRAIAAEGEQPAKIVGYAAVFDQESDPLGGFVEVIAPGAFDDVLGADVRALFNHDANYLLGRTASGTLTLSVDAVGLRYEIAPPDTQTVRDLVLAPLARRDLSGSSFSFRIARGGDRWDEDGDGRLVRTITRIGELLDVGPVAFPAYPDSTAAQRSLDAWRQTRTEGDPARHRVAREARERDLYLLED